MRHEWTYITRWGTARYCLRCGTTIWWDKITGEEMMSPGVKFMCEPVRGVREFKAREEN